MSCAEASVFAVFPRTFIWSFPYNCPPFVSSLCKIPSAADRILTNNVILRCEPVLYPLSIPSEFSGHTCLQRLKHAELLSVSLNALCHTMNPDC